jgi:hypothetical protein
MQAGERLGTPKLRPWKLPQPRIGEQNQSRLSLLRAYVSFGKFLGHSAPPWLGQIPVQ